jgi:hypothetical protein
MLSQRYERGSTLITSNLPFREPCLVEICFQFSQTYISSAFVNDARPFGYEVKQHSALLIIHRGGLQALRLDCLSVLAGAKHKIGQVITENRLLPLSVVKRI